jgi:ribosomal protein S18 acetylase RimI-like enzyme
MADMWDFVPSWQNSFDAIFRKGEGFSIIGAFDKSDLVGYGIIELASGDIPQLAVAKKYRRLGIGSAILKELLKHEKNDVVKIINADCSCEALTCFLQNNGIPKSGAQFEMVKQL